MTDVVWFVAIASLGTLVQSVVGFGGAMFSIPLFVLFIDPRQAVPTYTLTLLVVELILLIETWRHVIWSRVAILLGGALLGVPIGAYVLASLPSELLRFIVSLLTLLFAILFTCRVKIPVRETPAAQLGVGFTSGLLGGAISISGPPIVIFGLARNWPKDAFRATLVAFFFSLSIIALFWFGGFGLVNRGTFITAGAAFLPVILVSHLGIRIKRNVSESTFRNLVLAVIITVSILGLVQLFMR